MTDSTQKLQAIISGLEIDEAQKNGLLDRLANEGPTKEVFQAVQGVIDAAENKLSAEDPDLKEIEQAKLDFELEMSQIEKEAAQLEKDVTAQLDKVDIDATRQAINQG
jgi:hypothetical protein